MKLKNKLLTIITPILVVGSIAPVIVLSSCKTKEDDKKIPTKIINLSKTTNLKDINAETAPFCALNTNQEISCSICISMPAQTNVTVAYQRGTLNGGVITWDDSWTELTNKGEEIITSTIDAIEYNHPYRFYAYNTTNAGQFTTDTYSSKSIKFSFVMKAGTTKSFPAGEGIRIAGTARSLLGTKAISKEGTLETVDDLVGASENAFCYLFSGDNNVETLNKEPLICEVNPGFLPFKTMQRSCYYNMFKGNSNLLTAPDLPSTSLAISCYNNMFNGCYTLENAPYLPAKTLADYCYASMFEACRSLKSVSIGYVGNIFTEYFSSWLTKAGDATAEPILFYDGEDTQRSHETIPDSFTIKSKKDSDPAWLAANTKVFEIKTDKDISTTQTSKFTDEQPKTKFRVYNDATIKEFEKQIPATTSLVSGIENKVYYKKNASNETEIVDLSEEGITISDLPSTLYVKYEAPKDKEDKNVTNVVAESSTTVKCASKASGCTLQYWDKGSSTWKSFNQGTEINISANETLKIKGKTGSNSKSNYTNLRITGDCKLTGTVMALLSDDEPATSLTSDYCFYSLFEKSTGIKSVSQTYMPASTVELTKGCYAYMFQDCSGLTKALDLPATTLKEGCYEGMFKDCTGITGGPENWELKAETVPNDAYYSLFQGCTALESAPKILAKTVEEGRYEDGYYYSGMCSMFYDCESLTTAPEMKNLTSIGKYAMVYMFEGCTNLKDASTIKLADPILKKGCYLKMFKNCYSLVKFPDMTAITTSSGTTSSGNGACEGMFCYSSDRTSKARIINNTATDGTLFVTIPSYSGSCVDFNYMFSKEPGQRETASKPSANTKWYWHVS